MTFWRVCDWGRFTRIALVKVEDAIADKLAVRSQLNNYLVIDDFFK
ncbi:MAG: hypothetical protein F6J96_13095 [Symploca sp. SIO1C2]|nr:hypothetical protein [Symploca sp. SIO1C2]